MTLPTRHARRFHRATLVGPVLLILVLWQVDIGAMLAVVSTADWRLLLAAWLLNLPMVLLKSLRWQVLMRSQQLHYPMGKAYLAYFGSIFIGFLTPGRLGEFVKALHVSRDCQVSVGRAFASVLVDRLLDLYLLLLVGGTAMVALVGLQDRGSLLALTGVAGLLILPLVLFLHDRSFQFFTTIGLRLGRIGQKLFAPDSALLQLRQGLQQLSGLWVLAGIALTICAQAMFFSQCYLLALALQLEVSIVTTSFAVALGSLITLLPISISGLGTREATIIAYLGTADVAPAGALSFSLLVFLTFYVGGGVMGAGAWWLKPAPLAALRARQVHDDMPAHHQP
jgi:hypothetical protein